MISSRELLAESVLNSQMLLKRYLAGFDDSNVVSQPAGLPNHAAWTLGHLACTMGRMIEKLGGPNLAADEFTRGGEGGSSTRFDPDSVSFGSTPIGDASKYPPLARCVQIFDSACERLAATVRTVPEPMLTGMVPWGNTEISGMQGVIRMVFHNGTHAGQLADIRRALKLKSIFA